MGKKNKHNKLGRTIQKDRFSSQNKLTGPRDEWLHSSQIDEDADWARLNLHSVTEQSSLDDFLATAQLAGTEFTAEKLNIKVIDSEHGDTAIGEDEKRAIMTAQKENAKFLRIPRRPAWTTDMTADELQLRERDYFLTWRKQLSELQENNHLILTPFEKNLELWRQLWRVIERSHVIVQIVDARNPLLFRCQDLEAYVKEVDAKKVNLLLLSKADLLTVAQRSSWAKYLTSINVKFAFWSANMELEDNVKCDNSVSASNRDNDDAVLEDYTSSSTNDTDDDEAVNEVQHQDTGLEIDKNIDSKIAKKDCERDVEQESNDTKILSGEEIITLFKNLYANISDAEADDSQAKAAVIGLVGYPNVGKSSTINALFQSKKVSVSATPGKTKHFQTLYLDKDLCLCDCPGLVFPSFVSTKAEMIVCGVLPIDQMREWNCCDIVTILNGSSQVCERIPREILESIYGISLPVPGEGENVSRPPTPHELLTAYGFTRGYMTVHGEPDVSRSARYILKDFVNGKLQYCCPPPDVDPVIFQDQFSTYKIRKIRFEQKLMEKMHGRRDNIDEDFFSEKLSKVHLKGKMIPASGTKLNAADNEIENLTNKTNKKPWKRHFNKHKKEKLRRIYNN